MDGTRESSSSFLLFSSLFSAFFSFPLSLSLSLSFSFSPLLVFSSFKEPLAMGVESRADLKGDRKVPL